MTSLQMMHAKRADRIQNGENHNSHIGKNCEPHIGDADGAKPEADKFDGQGKYDILVYDSNTLS